MKRIKKKFCLLLCVALVLEYLPVSVNAEDLSEIGLCEHHTQHVGCSYVPAVSAAECAEQGVTDIDAAECIVLEEQQAKETAQEEAAAYSSEVLSDLWSPLEIIQQNTKETRQTEEQESGDSDKVAYGICGENLTWALYEDGVLFISGRGEMSEFTYMEAPWHIHGDLIECIHVENGVETISDYAFAQLVSLREVFLPLSVISIGRGAFLPGYVYVDFIYEGCEHQWSNVNGNDDVLEKGSLYCIENENEWDEDHTTEFSCSVCGLVIEPAIPHDYEHGICTICGFEDPEYTIVDFGSCGDNLTWSFEENGTLTISGTGDMDDNPWFQYSDSITSVILEEGLTSIADRAFEECYQLTKMSIPDSVTTIGDYAFASCYCLDDISISEKVTYIGEGAFADCSSIERIILPVSITGISDSLFAGCTKLSCIQLSASIVSIDDYAFALCEKLNSITIPEGVITIGMCAFKESGLKTVVLPKSIENIGIDAFDPENIFYAGNENDRNQIILGSYDYFVTESNWHYNSTEPHSFIEVDTLDIEPTCTEVGFFDGTHCSICNSVFRAQYEVPALGHDYQLKITPPSCTERGYTTYSCSRCADNYLDDYIEATGHTEKIDEEVLPSCVETGLTEGYHCSVCDEVLLEQEIIPAHGHLFDDYIFNEDATCTRDGTMTSACAYGCGTTDTQIAEASMLGHVEVWDEGYEPTCTETGLTEGYHCSVCDEVLLEQEIIPALGHSYEMDFCKTCGEIDFSIFPITGTSGRFVSWVLNSEGVMTFTGTGEMETVNWGRYADYVKTVVVAEGINSIAENAFSVLHCPNGYGYKKITDITLPDSLNRIGESAFEGCSGLQSISIPPNITTIEDRAFSGCTSLKSILLPDCITSIESHAFSYCDNLEIISIPQCVTHIGKGAFYDSGLQEVCILGGGTTPLSIGTSCFKYCSNLREISIPRNIVEIGNDAFVECISLNDVYYYGTEIDRNAMVIGSNNSWLTGAVWHYKSACKDGHTEVTDEPIAPTCTASGLTEGKHCSVCGEILVAQTVVEATGIHSYVGGKCEYCGEEEPKAGDLDGDGEVSERDAVALLWQILFPEQLPSDNGSDIDGNGTVNADDVTYLLWHTLFPDLYPL